MMTEGKHEGTPQEEGDDALWRLLARAPQPRPVSPYFARRVLREVAVLEGARPTVGRMSNWLARTWQAWRQQGRGALAGALAAVVFLAAGVGFFSTRRHSPDVAVTASRPEPLAATASGAVPVVTGIEEPVPTAELVESDPNPQPTVALSSVSSEPVVTAQDVEVIADLDNLLSREESRLWTEDDTARF